MQHFCLQIKRKLFWSIGTNSRSIVGRQPSLGNISTSRRDTTEGGNGSRFIGAKNFFSSLSGMADTGSTNDEEYYEDFNDEPHRVTRYEY